MTNMNDKTENELKAVAQLIGATSANLNMIDEQIVGESTHLKKTKGSWNPQDILKDHINKAGGHAPDMQPALGSDPAMQQPPMHQPVPASMPVVPPPGAQTIHVPVQVPAGYNDQAVNDRLDSLSDKVDKLQITFDKILNGILKNKTKQITIKFDDSKD